MQLLIDIPDELIPVVVRIMQEKHFPDDNGRTEVYIIRDLDIDAATLSKAENIVDSIQTQIEEKSI